MTNSNEFTEAEIRRMPRRDVTVKQFLEICSHFEDPMAQQVTDEMLRDLGDGAFLGVHTTDGKKFVRLYLKTIWITPYSLSYRTTKTKDGKAREGKEIMISNMKLPKRIKFK